MKWFSQRKGLKPTKTEIQIDSMDSDLRNRLWNALTRYYWSQCGWNIQGFHYAYKDLELLRNRIWHSHFKAPFHTMGSSWDDALREITEHFFGCEWYEVYDFIEFAAYNYPNAETNQRFTDQCNSILEEEISAYRFVGGRITQITSEEEISEIEEALATPPKPVQTHLKKALDLLSDKKAPDYRNSIKESISAVESMCNKITGSKKATLGKCLDKIDSKMPTHGALREAFDHLYGYASSEEGIRHGSIEESEVDFDIAKFMLVSCSAFVNYLVSKASKAGIEI